MGRKRMLTVLSVLLTFFLCAGMILEYSRKDSRAEAAAGIALGSKGDKVSEVQRKLKQWGYYSGPVDGVYGQKTYEAVISFQQKNGLNQDGTVETKTANALGIRLNGNASSAAGPAQGGGGNSNDVYLLAKVIQGEARGEPYLGKVAVAAVVLNRVKNASFPNTIAGVVYQPGAFTCVSDGQINLAPDEESLRAARDAMNGWDPTYGAIYYFNPATATSAWIWSRPVHIIIGKHKFAT